MSRQCCCVPRCSSRNCKSTGPSHTGVTFHSFPCDLEQRDKWIRVIRLKSWEDWLPTENSHVCSRHFSSSDFTVSQDKKKQLLKFAVPSQFPEYYKKLMPSGTKDHEVPSNSNKPGKNYIKIIVGNNNTLNSLNTQHLQNVSESKSTNQKQLLKGEPFIHSITLQKNYANQLSLSNKIPEFESSIKLQLPKIEPIESSVTSKDSVSDLNLSQSQETQESASIAIKDSFVIEPISGLEVLNKNSILNNLIATGLQTVRKPQSTHKRKQSLVRNAIKRSRIPKSNPLRPSYVSELNKKEEFESKTDTEQITTQPAKYSQVNDKNYSKHSNSYPPMKIEKCKSTTSLQQFSIKPVKYLVATKQITNIQPTVTNQSNFNIFCPEIIKIKKIDSIVTSEHMTGENSKVANENILNQLSLNEPSLNNATDTVISNTLIRNENIHKCIQVSPECYDQCTVANLPPLKHVHRVDSYQKQIKEFQRKLRRNEQTIKLLKEKLKETKNEIVKYKTDPYIRSLTNVLQHAEDGDHSALYIQDLVLNYKKNKFKCVDIPIQSLMTNPKDMVPQLSLLGTMIKQQSSNS